MSKATIITGSSNIPLAQKVAAAVRIPLGEVELTRFADGESRPYIKEDIKGKTVYILQSFSFPVDQNIMEMMLLGDAVRRGNPKELIAIVPYMGYMRQDKQHRIGEPISSQMIAQFFAVPQFDRIITIDIHRESVIDFFTIPVRHLSATSLLIQKLNISATTKCIVVAPDEGAGERARSVAKQLKTSFIVMEKKRYLDREDIIKDFQLKGNVRNSCVIIVDDLVSTGDTITQSAMILKSAGAGSIQVLATHPIFADAALEKIEQSPIDTIIVTDTIPTAKAAGIPQLQIVSVAPLLAQAL